MQDKKAGVVVVWRYHAYLTHDVEPVEEEREWLDTETANLKQVDLNAYFLVNGTPSQDGVFEQRKLTEQLYANAMACWEEPGEKDNTLDKRA